MSMHMCVAGTGEEPHVSFLKCHPLWRLSQDLSLVWSLPASPRDLPVSFSPALGLQACGMHLAFSHGLWSLGVHDSSLPRP